MSVKAIAESLYSATSIKEVTSSFNVHFTNPCIDTDFVTILNAPFDTLYYTIGDDDAETFTHQEFIVFTKPLVGHTLCGDLTYTPYYDDQPLEPTGPVSYDPAAREFSVKTADPSYE